MVKSVKMVNPVGRENGKNSKQSDPEIDAVGKIGMPTRAQEW